MFENLMRVIDGFLYGVSASAAAVWIYAGLLWKGWL